MNIIQKIDHFITQHNLITPGQTIIVALSGGPDSVFLLHYLAQRRKELNLTLIAAHLDHQWRATSADDAHFCVQLCQQLQIPLELAKMSELTYQPKLSGSKEQDARHARRHFFTSTAHKYKAGAIALAHHKDDQEETFFIRLLRGATVTGLASIWPKHGTYIRPLLEISKDEILTWLDKHNSAYAIDPTNESSEYLRNRIRNELLPVIKKIDPRFEYNCAKVINHLQQTELFLQRITTYTFNAIARFDSDHQKYVIDLKQFFAQDAFLQYRLLMHWLTTENVTLPASTAFLDEIIRFLQHPTNKKHTIHHDWSLIKQNNYCYIDRQ